MKPQSFEYVAPRDVAAALDVLARHGDEAKVLAGGQSLVPVMNLRLARPAVLVDINGVTALAALEVRDDHVAIGALVRHRALELGRAGRDGLGALLSRVAGHIGHVPVRVRGTFAGSLAHADPAAEWGLVAVTLGAELDIVGPGGPRVLAAEEFLVGPFTTALRPDELLVRVRVPRRAGWGYGFAEQARTHGAFAQAGACAALAVDGGVVTAARVGVMGAGGRAQLLPGVARALAGAPVATAPDTAAAAAPEELAPAGYDEVSGDYLRAVLAALVRRAVGAAVTGEHRVAA